MSHRHLLAQLRALREIVQHDRWHPQPVLSWLPLHHDLGLVGFLVSPMRCGCPLVLQPPGQSHCGRRVGWRRCPAIAAVTGAPPAALRLVTLMLEAGTGSACRTIAGGTVN